MLSRTMVEHSVFDALAAEAAVKVQLDLFFRRTGLSSGAAVGVGTASTRAAAPSKSTRILASWAIFKKVIGSE